MADTAPADPRDAVPVTPDTTSGKGILPTSPKTGPLEDASPASDSTNQSCPSDPNLALEDSFDELAAATDKLECVVVDSPGEQAAARVENNEPRELLGSFAEAAQPLATTEPLPGDVAPEDGIAGDANGGANESADVDGPHAPLPDLPVTLSDPPVASDPPAEDGPAAEDAMASAGVPSEDAGQLGDGLMSLGDVDIFSDEEEFFGMEGEVPSDVLYEKMLQLEEKLQDSETEVVRLRRLVSQQRKLLNLVQADMLDNKYPPNHPMRSAITKARATLNAVIASRKLAAFAPPAVAGPSAATSDATTAPDTAPDTDTDTATAATSVEAVAGQAPEPQVIGQEGGQDAVAKDANAAPGKDQASAAAPPKASTGVHHWVGRAIHAGCQRLIRWVLRCH